MILMTMTITMAMMETIMIALSCWCRLSTVEAHVTRRRYITTRDWGDRVKL